MGSTVTGFPCLHCGAPATRVVETRERLRRRACRLCKLRFSTTEVPNDVMEAIQQELQRLRAFEKRNKGLAYHAIGD